MLFFHPFNSLSLRVKLTKFSNVHSDDKIVNWQKSEAKTVNFYEQLQMGNIHTCSRWKTLSRINEMKLYITMSLVTIYIHICNLVMSLSEIDDEVNFHTCGGNDIWKSISGIAHFGCYWNWMLKVQKLTISSVFKCKYSFILKAFIKKFSNKNNN